jgi:hypothetical protein
MSASSPQSRAPTEEVAGLVERVAFFNEESGFSVLRVKVRRQREPVTVLGSLSEGPGEPRRPTGPLPANAASRVERRRVAGLRQRVLKMAQEEGAAAILLPSHEEGRNVDTGLLLDDNGVELTGNAQLRENAVPVPYAVVMTEHYNRLARLAQAHVPVTVELNIQTAFTGDHEHGFNTIAEIPGTDKALKDQVVMVGGHLDSWPAGTGATDNGAGAVIAMEAVRILKALEVKPKRTLRIALWSGEEEGEFGSAGYVQRHFLKSSALADSPTASASTAMDAPKPLVTTKEWETLDAYYNIASGCDPLPMRRITGCGAAEASSRFCYLSPSRTTNKVWSICAAGGAYRGPRSHQRSSGMLLYATQRKCQIALRLNR